MASWPPITPAYTSRGYLRLRNHSCTDKRSLQSISSPFHIPHRPSIFPRLVACIRARHMGRTIHHRNRCPHCNSQATTYIHIDCHSCTSKYTRQFAKNPQARLHRSHKQTTRMNQCKLPSVCTASRCRKLRTKLEVPSRFLEDMFRYRPCPRDKPRCHFYSRLGKPHRIHIPRRKWDHCHYMRRPSSWNCSMFHRRNLPCRRFQRNCCTQAPTRKGRMPTKEEA